MPIIQVLLMEYIFKYKLIPNAGQQNYNPYKNTHKPCRSAREIAGLVICQFQVFVVFFALCEMRKDCRFVGSTKLGRAGKCTFCGWCTLGLGILQLLICACAAAVHVPGAKVSELTFAPYNQCDREVSGTQNEFNRFCLESSSHPLCERVALLLTIMDLNINFDICVFSTFSLLILH